MDFNIDNYISNLQYINKDFNSLWEEILETIPKMTDKWDPNEANESDPLVILLKELGIISDKINYNTDKNILESFPDLLTQLRTAYSVFNSMGYNPNWYRSATTTINIIYNGGTENNSYIDVSNSGLKGKEITIPKFTSFCDDESNVVYTTLEDVTFNLGEIVQKSVRAIEGTINNYEINGSTKITADNLDSENRLYFTQNNIAQNGIYISSDEEFKNFDIDSYNTIDLSDRTSMPTIASNTVWKRVDNLYQYLPVSYVFKFGIDPSNGANYIQFPEDVGTLINDGIYIKYILSNGEAGNIKKSTLSSFLDTSFSVSAGEITITDDDGNSTTSEENVIAKNFTINNAVASQNGKDPETISEMQKNYQKVVGTFNTLVTLRDYENYIYSYENNLGNNLVSNIRVSDRTNDLYDTIPYTSLKLNGDEINKKIASGDKEELTVYDLRLYPLPFKASITSKEDYDNTFKYSKETTEEDSATPKSKETAIKNILSAIDDVKCISHNYTAEAGEPIILNYDIEGQIYLQKSVSKSEAKEIKANIDLAIYQNFNARKINFGEPIDYSTLVNVVKNADPRIQYVAINPISYKVDEDSLSQLSKSKYLSSNYDVTKRAILKGVTPWTDFEDFSYQWGQTNNKTLNTSVKDETTGKEKNQNFIKSYIEVTDAGKKATTYTVSKNESLNFIIPEYVSKTAYSNYFYLVNTYTDSTELKHVALTANVPHVLEGKETISIYEERPWKTESSEPVIDTSVKPKITLKAGTIVRSNLDIGKEYGETTALNMSSKYILEVVDKDISDIKNTSIIGDAVASPQIKIATNSIGLINYLKNPTNSDNNTYKVLGDNGKSTEGGGYLLNLGEYLMWANDTDPVLEVGLIGEGNTIIASEKIDDISIKNLILTSSDNLDSIEFVKVNSNVLKYQTNILYSLGEGNTITATKNGEAVTLLSNYNGSGKEEYPFYINADTINYKNKSGEGTITGATKNDLIHGLLTLKLLSSSSTSQELESNDNSKQHVEIINRSFNDTTVTDIPIASIPNGENNSFYTSAALEYAGGAGLYLTDEEADILNFLTYKNSLSISFSTYFRTLNEKENDGKGDYIKIPIPGQKDDIFITPVIFTNTSLQTIVRNLIIKNDGTETQKIYYDSLYTTGESITGDKERSDTVYGLDQIGPIYKVKTDAKYYEANSKKDINSILGTDYIKILSTDYIYVIDFNAVNIPSDEELIKDPTEASSYLRKEHPYNNYSIPKLNSLDGLVISSLSIKE